MKLNDLQKHFLGALLSGDSTSLSGEIVPEARLAIYRNNVFSACEKALALTYPCVKKLVGEKFFAQAAAGFTRAYPPASGNLDRFGEGFAAFLRDYAPAASLPYLPDMAKLEWLMQEAALAGKGSSIDTSALSAIPPEKYFNLKLALHPSVRLIESRFPLLKLREFCEADGEGQLDLSEEEGVRALITRPHRTVGLHSLHPADFSFLSKIEEGETMYEAYAAAVAQDEGFDLAAFIHRQLGYGTFGGYSLGL